MIPPLTPIGRIAGKHGFRGELNLIIDHDQHRRRLKKGNYLFVEFDGKGVPFLIESVSGGGSIVKFADINHEAETARLQGKTILIESAHAGKQIRPAFSGLAGYSILDLNSGFTGKLVSVDEYPQGLMFTIQDDERELLIPGVEEWIAGIDEKRKIIHMNLPEGLTDL